MRRGWGNNVCSAVKVKIINFFKFGTEVKNSVFRKNNQQKTKSRTFLLRKWWLCLDMKKVNNKNKEILRNILDAEEIKLNSAYKNKLFREEKLK